MYTHLFKLTIYLFVLNKLEISKLIFFFDEYLDKLQIFLCFCEEKKKIVTIEKFQKFVIKIKKYNTKMEELGVADKFKIILNLIDNIPTFDGKNPNCLPEFIDRVENLMPSINIFDNFNARVLKGYVKDKIINEAKVTLQLHGNPTEWTEIKALLIRNHGEKLSPDVLLDKIRSCRVITTVENFYETLNKYLCRINNYYLLNNPNSVNNGIIESNKRIALEIFKNNLPEPARSVIFSRNPTSLTDAYETIVSGKYQKLGPKGTTDRQNSRENFSTDLQRNNFNPNRTFERISNRYCERNPNTNFDRNLNRNFERYPNRNFERNPSRNFAQSQQIRFPQNFNNSNAYNRNTNCDNAENLRNNLNRSGQFSQRSRRSNNFNNGVEPMDISMNEQNFQESQLNNYPI